jgi:large subunit ribosomal protein L1
MPKASKNLRNAREKIEVGKYYPLNDAVKLIKSMSFEKFDATVELAIRLNVDPRQADQNIRGAVSLPHGTGKTYTSLGLCSRR